MFVVPRQVGTPGETIGWLRLVSDMDQLRLGTRDSVPRGSSDVRGHALSCILPRASHPSSSGPLPRYGVLELKVCALLVRWPREPLRSLASWQPRQPTEQHARDSPSWPPSNQQRAARLACHPITSKTFRGDKPRCRRQKTSWWRRRHRTRRVHGSKQSVCDISRSERSN